MDAPETVFPMLSWLMSEVEVMEMGLGVGHADGLDWTGSVGVQDPTSHSCDLWLGCTQENEQGLSIFVGDRCRMEDRQIYNRRDWNSICCREV